VRSHARASTAGSTQRQAKGLGRFFRGTLATRGASPASKGSSAPSRGRLGALCAALCAFFLLATTALAGQGVTSFFGSNGEAGGQFKTPGGVAVKNSTGDVYVADSENRRVEQFDSTGAFVRAWGVGVVKSGPGKAPGTQEVQSIKIAATSGTFTLSFTPLGAEDKGLYTTAPIPFNASPGEVEAALEALESIGDVGGSVNATGGPGDATGSNPYLITFGGTLAGTDVGQISIDPSGLGVAVGTMLECSTTTVATTIEYQWLRNAVPIPGATSPNYTTVAADEGAPVQCQISAFNPNAGSLQTSDATVVSPFPSTAPPRPPSGDLDAPISNNVLAVGQGRGCNRSDAWLGLPSFSFQWYRNGVPLSGNGADTRSYTFQEADLETPAVFQCAHTGTNAGGSVMRASFHAPGLVTNPAPSPPAPMVKVSVAQLSSTATVAEGAPGFEVCTAAAGDVCKAGAAAAIGGGMSSPQGIAVDQASGAVYVSDQGFLRVQKFSATGVPQLAFGKDVDSGDGAATEVCTVAANCKTGVSGSLGGEFASTFSGHLAVAPAGSPNAGDVLVADPGNSRVQEFSSTGAFVRAFGFDVAGAGAGADNTGSGFEVCTQAVADAANCQAGVAGTDPGQFATSQPTRVAEDSTGAIYTVESTNTSSDARRVQKFTPQVGPPPLSPAVFAEATLSSTADDTAPTDVAIGASDHVYVVKQFSDGTGTPPATVAERRVLELDSAGALADTHMVNAKVNSVNGLGVNATSGAIYASSTTGDQRVYRLGAVSAPTATLDPVSILDPHGATFTGHVNPNGGLTEYRFEYRPDSSATWIKLPTADANAGPVGSNNAVTQSVDTLTPATLYHVRLVATQSFGPETLTTSEQEFTTPGEAPRISGAPVAARQLSAKLGGVVDPENEATEYHFEYGTSPCTAVPNPCQSTATGNVPVGPAKLVTAAISGLEFGKTYHYRLVATNGTGSSFLQRTFVTISQSTLPENRAHEQVSPHNKGSADAAEAFSQASVSGDAVSYATIGQTFPGNPGSQTYNPYLSTRNPDGSWDTKSLSPPFSPGIAIFQPLSLSADLTSFAFGSRKTLGAPGTGNGVFLRDTATGTDEPVMPLETFEQVNSTEGSLIVTSDDHSHFVFASEFNLTPDAAVGGTFVYDWSGGSLKLISRRSDGRPMQGFVGALAARYSDHQVAADGSRIFWSRHTPSADNIYATDTATGIRTVVGASERSAPDPAGPKDRIYVDASVDGGKTFFISAEKLTDDSTAASQTSNPEFGPLAIEPFDKENVGELYRYDFSRPAGERLIDLTVAPNDPKGAQVVGKIDASDDGSRIYFVALGVLDDGAVAGQPNVYLWDYNGGSPFVRYIATLNKSSSVDKGNVEMFKAHYLERRPLASPNGERVLFRSTAQLTPANSAGTAQLYLYDAPSDRLECVSCRPDGSASNGNASFGSAGILNMAQHQQRSISADGSRVFFETTDSLLDRDSNGTDDVYEWHEGQLHLLSDGQSPSPSHFVDASASGDDVFFTSRAQLSAADGDTLADVYDARVNGIPASGALPPSPCLGDSCQPPPVVPNDPTPASAAFHGAGDPVPASSCAHAAGRAAKLAREAKRLRILAGRLTDERRAHRLRHRAARYAKGARRLSGGAKRCRSARNSKRTDDNRRANR